MLPLGAWIKQRRKELDLTQEELALRVGCSLVMIQKIESGERRPSKQIARLLAQQLGVSEAERPDFVRFARSRDNNAQAGSRAPWRASRFQFSNLPVPPTPLFGRHEEIAAIHGKLLHEQARLLTLLGPPGIGKTRLAIEAASRMADEFDDGVFFVSLAAVTEPEQVVASIAQVLAVKETGESSLLQQVAQRLVDKRILLLLDNLEQVVAAAPLVAELLATCPWLQILATSRVPLHIRAERQFHVRPLGLPPIGLSFDPQRVLDYPAAALFLDRAQAVEPEFSANDENAALIAQVCTRLDGLPLAIELVAAWAGQIPLSGLLEQLSNRLVLLNPGPRDLPARQQTMRSAIEWSFALLSLAERQLIARLSVFAGGFTVEMAELISEGLAPSQVRIQLNRLVDQNLVLDMEAGGGQRFEMLEAIRQYAREQLEQGGEAEIFLQRHSACMLEMAERADLHQPAWLERLELEHENLRAVFQHALGAADALTALRLCTALLSFWQIRGHLSEGLANLTAALNLKVEPSDQRLKLMRARLLVGAGWLLRDFGDFTQARDFFERGLALYQELSIPAGLAYALYSVGYIQFLIGDAQTGIRVIEESLALYRSLGDKKGEALALFMLGRIATGQGNYLRARSCLDECLQLEQGQGETFGLARTLGSLGELAIYQGEAALAAAQLAESQSLLEKMGERQLCAWVMVKRGELTWHLGHFAEARAFLKRSLHLAQEIGYRWNEAYALAYLGVVSLAEGDLRQALDYCEHSLALFTVLKSEGDIAQTRKDLARMLLASGEIDSAAEIYRQCLAAFQPRGYVPDIIECLEGLAAVLTARREPAGAVRLYAVTESQRALIGMPLPPVLHPLYQNNISELRSILGDDEFRVHWEQGCKLTIELAVRDALA